MSFLAWVALGLIAALITSAVVHHRGAGIFLDILLGMAGSVVGGWLFAAYGRYYIPGVNLYSLLVAVVGAIVVLFVYHALVRRSA